MTGRVRSRAVPTRAAGRGKVMTAAERHDAVPPPSTVARQLKRVAREGRWEHLVLRNEAKPSGGSPVRQPTRNLKTYGLSEVPTMITSPSWRGMLPPRSIAKCARLTFSGSSRSRALRAA